jgi:hypothetical protein
MNVLSFIKELFGYAAKPAPRKPNVIFPKYGNEIGFHTFAIPSLQKKAQPKVKVKPKKNVLDSLIR